MIFRAVESGFSNRDGTVIRFPERPGNVTDTERNRAGDRAYLTSCGHLARPLVGGALDRPLRNRSTEQMLAPALGIEDSGST